MDNELRKVEFWKRIDAVGELEVRHNVTMGKYTGPHKAWAHEWITNEISAETPKFALAMRLPKLNKWTSRDLLRMRHGKLPEPRKTRT